MKKIHYLFIVAALASTAGLTSCMDEPVPTDGATQKQIEASEKATEAILWGMPAILNKFETVDEVAYDWGYGSIMHIRDVMTEEYVVNASNYDWYQAWEQNRSIGENFLTAQFLWNYYWKYVQACNAAVQALGSINRSVITDAQLGGYGVAHAFRAHAYLDLARMYEFLPSDIYPDSTNAADNNIMNLTVPIVTEKVTEDSARNNPRVHRDVMAAFIESDLDTAEYYIDHYNYRRPTKAMPDLTVVFGLKARLYMWIENYAKAYEYATKAINLGLNRPLTRDEWLSTTSGFNSIDASSWMWGVQQMKEDAVVKSGILNWTSWVSNEASYGYAAAGPQPMINAATYAGIDNSDFRKLSWKAPAGTPLAGRELYCADTDPEDLLDYASLKFRPAQGNTEKYEVGSASAYPLMRIEEMYFIQAEAAAHQDAAQGAALLNSFMQQYRYPNYNLRSTDPEEVIDEIFFQKRIELWGEGLSFFDYKRLNKPVTRRYAGTNFAASARFNTTTRPAWMSFVIVQTEQNNNKALVGFNNPDPSDRYSTAD